MSTTGAALLGDVCGSNFFFTHGGWRGREREGVCGGRRRFFVENEASRVFEGERESRGKGVAEKRRHNHTFYMLMLPLAAHRADNKKSIQRGSRDSQFESARLHLVLGHSSLLAWLRMKHAPLPLLVAPSTFQSFLPVTKQTRSLSKNGYLNAIE
jgi:hypothetical protein